MCRIEQSKGNSIAGEVEGAATFGLLDPACNFLIAHSPMQFACGHELRQVPDFHTSCSGGLGPPRTRRAVLGSFPRPDSASPAAPSRVADQPASGDGPICVLNLSSCRSREQVTGFP